jgi:hypothetical protein
MERPIDQPGRDPIPSGRGVDACRHPQAAGARRIHWRKQALDRARARGIDREQVFLVLETGDLLEERHDAKPFPKYLLMALVVPNRPLYAAASHDDKTVTIFVITVHWLDPKKWEDPWTRPRKLLE